MKHHAPPGSPSQGVDGHPYWVVAHASNSQDAWQAHSQRLPQSSQSEPRVQELHAESCPPSSHTPSLLYSGFSGHVLSHAQVCAPTSATSMLITAAKRPARNCGADALAEVLAAKHKSHGAACNEMAKSSLHVDVALIGPQTPPLRGSPRRCVWSSSAVTFPHRFSESDISSTEAVFLITPVQRQEHGGESRDGGRRGEAGGFGSAGACVHHYRVDRA